MERRYIKYSAVMVLLFLVGGFSLIMYMFQAYSAFWGSEAFSLARERWDYNRSMLGNRSFAGERLESFSGPGRANVFTSPLSLLLLLVGISSTLGGVSIWRLIREKELKSVKENISSLLLLPEERMVISELGKSGGKINQNQLVKRTGLSKVRIHRILVKLEMKKIITRYPYGLTNMVVLEKTAL